MNRKLKTEKLSYAIKKELSREVSKK